MTRRPALHDYALLGLLALLWGVSYNLVKITVQTIPPLTLTAVRFVLGFALLAVVLRARGESVFAAGLPWGRLSVQAAVNNVLPWSLTAWAAMTIDSGLVTILNSTSPIFAFLITWAITRHEPATAAKLAGAVTGLLGVVVIVGVGALQGLGAHLAQQAACVLGALLFGIAAVHGRHLDALPPLRVATLTLFAGASAMVPVCLAAEQPWTVRPSLDSLLALLALCVFSTAAAVFVYYRILSTMGSIAAASQSYLRIVVGVSIGIVFLGEHLTLERFVGMSLILVGVVVMTRPGPRTAGSRVGDEPV